MAETLCNLNREGGVRVEEITGTTTASGALRIPLSISNTWGEYVIVSAIYTDEHRGVIFQRRQGDSYLHCTDMSMQPITNEQISVKVAYLTDTMWWNNF